MTGILPWFNKLMDKSLTMGVDDLLRHGPAIGLITLSVGIVSGLYPALFLSGFPPLHAIRQPAMSRSRGGFRRLLVMVQFAMATGLIVGRKIPSRLIGRNHLKPNGHARHAAAIRSADPVANGWNNGFLYCTPMTACIDAEAADIDFGRRNTEKKPPRTRKTVMRRRLIHVKTDPVGLGKANVLPHGFTESTACPWA